MIFKEIETDQEWSIANNLRNIYNWTNPITLEEAKSSHERSRADRHDIRMVGMMNDEIVSYLMVMENTNSATGDYWFSILVDPSDPRCEESYRASVEECMRQVAQLGGKRGMIESRGEYKWEKSIFENLEFSKDMRLPFSCLAVSETTFEFQPEVVSFAQFMESHPEDGIHQIWRCEMDCAAGLPLPFPFVETPFEIYRKRVLDDPQVDLNSKFLFYENGVLKGLSTLWASKVNAKLAQTGLTGTRPEYRRQGVARKMKQHAIRWAQERGIEKVFTDNEENNPMYQLNLQLGFRTLFDYEVYSKPC